jgi:predicted ATP-dependent endonuclease of OLD family
VTEKSLRHKFFHICDETKNEGFFANKVLIIEGDTEKYALPLYFSHAGFDLDNERVAIISAGSVDNITYLYAVFNEFHIPCYIIFDGDKPTAAEFEKIERLKKAKPTSYVRRSKIKVKGTRTCWKSWGRS